MVSESIRCMMEKRNMNGNDMANVLGCTSQNIYQTLLRDKWNLNQLIKYANSLDYDVEIVLKDRKSNERIVCDANRG